MDYLESIIESFVDYIHFETFLDTPTCAEDEVSFSLTTLKAF